MDMAVGCIGGMWGMGLFGLLLVAGLVGIVLAIVYAARRSGRADAGPDASGDGALATLRERFARGELDSEEYARRHRLLEAGQAGTL